MRTLIAFLIVATLAGTANADRYDRGLRARRGGAALLVIGSALIMAAAPVIMVSLIGGLDDPTVPRSPNPLELIGIALGATGIAAQAAGLPLYIDGTSDIDRWRNGQTATLGTVRF